MGAISFSIDRKLVETVQGILHAKTFVETGTFEGDSVACVADLFETVLTVECSQEYFDISSRRFHDRANISVALDDSPVFLKEVRDKVGDSAIFWLDAHWCLADSTSGQQSQCPLLAELEAIGKIGLGSVIMIDDARLFMSAPPKPHEITHWPTLSQVTKRLAKISARHSLMILNDVIIFYPPILEKALRDYSHEHSVDWLHIIDESREYKAILEAERSAAAERLELLESATAENEKLRPVAAEAQNREALLNQNDAAQRQLFADLSERDRQVAELSAALEEARAGWLAASNESEVLRRQLEIERSAAAERLALLESAAAENEHLRLLADEARARLFENLKARDRQISELSVAVEAERSAALERLQLLEGATAENERLRGLADEALAPLLEDLKERERQIAELSVAVEAERSAALERLQLLEQATLENERLRRFADETPGPLIADLEQRNGQITELTGALDAERSAAVERLALLERSTAENERLRGAIDEAQALVSESSSRHDQEIAELSAALAAERLAAAERLELLERATAENEQLRALAAEAQTPLVEQLHERDRQIAELSAALEAERSAAAERLALLESATVELQQQIQHATERASIIDSLTEIVEKQQRAAERGGGR